MKALLIDDERLARNELRGSSPPPGDQIAGEAANAKQAREQMAALKPDLLFLDVQMPGETGIELLESLEPPGAAGHLHDRLRRVRGEGVRAERARLPP
jgi:two-component system, LytTR family, response regulator